MTSKAATQLRFRVALSFPGERREYVEAVANLLSEKLGNERILYDKYFEHEFARLDLDTYLQSLYHDESELIAVFLCSDYAKKDWCGLEWRAIKDLIKRRDMATIMPLRFDRTEIPGLFSTDGYVEIGSRTPAVIADLILKRLAMMPIQGQVKHALEEMVYASEAKGLSRDAAVFSREGNIFWALDGDVRQLTFTGKDEMPFLMADGQDVVFVRSEEYVGHSRKSLRKIIVQVAIKTLREKIILDRKPFEDGLEGTTNIIRVRQPVLSPDGDVLYFLSEYAAVGDGLMRVDLRTGEFKCIAAADDFELLTTAPYRGCFLVAYTDVRGSGRMPYCRMSDEHGNTVKEFANWSVGKRFVEKLQAQPTSADH